MRPLEQYGHRWEHNINLYCPDLIPRLQGMSSSS